MKKIFLITILITLLSCDRDGRIDYTNPLNNNWFMQDASIFDIPSLDLNKQYVLWSFNNNTLNVVNYFLEDNIFLQTGSYSFTYTETTISIEIDEINTIEYNYSFDDGNLVLSDNPASISGILLNFTPKENDCINDPLEDLAWLKEIKNTMELSMNPSGSQIIQYQYENQCVYLIRTCFNCGDELMQVYNAVGEVICESGGLEGLNTCPNFYDTATNKRYLFNNVQGVENNN